MDTTSIIGKDGTPVIVNSPNGHDRDRGHDGVRDLILATNVADNSRAVLGAISDSTASILASEGVHSVAALNATNLASVSNLKATGDASVANLKATGDASVAGLKATGDSTVAINKNVYDGTVSTNKNIYDGTVSINKNLYDGVVSTTKAVTDGTVANMNATNLAAVSITKNISDAAAAAAVAASAAAIAAKDIQIAIAEDGCKTREQGAEHFAKLQYQAEQNKNDIEKEMLKGFHTTQLEALRNKCELEKQIAEICCCVEKDGNITRSLVLAENTKRLESELQEARLRAAIAGLGTCEKGNGK